MPPKKYPPIPRSLTLPGGFKIKTRIVCPKVLTREGLKDAHGAWLVDTDPPGGTILIDSSDSFDSRWDTFVHEIHHAITDWDHHIRDTVITPFVAELGKEILEEKE